MVLVDAHSPPPKLVPHGSLQDVFAHADGFATALERERPAIQALLRRYESHEVVEDELTRSLDALRNLREISKYFSQDVRVDSAVAFLPLNLPLYSFVLFGAMPAYQADSVVLRAPERLRGLFSELFSVLSLDRHYPNVSLFCGSRSEFLSKHCAHASVVMFTGKHENFLEVRRACRPDALLLFSGAGHNPVVVAEGADLDIAVRKTLHVKLFNCGQDCAGPDVILVHKAVASKFIDTLKTALADVRVGSDYDQDEITVGPLFESSAVLAAAALIQKLCASGARIAYGGQIDVRHNVVHPCVVVNSLKQRPNFTEIFAPIFVVTVYDVDEDLAAYFGNDRYKHNQMYVSLFGESALVESLPKSIVIRNQTIHDVERGTSEFGGFGPGASAVSIGGVSKPQPILIPREIHQFALYRHRRVGH